jgi:hypothetical protein
MSTPSMVLLCAGAASSLAGVWALAGLSEKSSLRGSGRALGAAAVGLVGSIAVWQGAPAALRSELLLPALFGAASVLALAAGAGKLDAALAEKDGPRAVRRAVGLLGGTFLGMVAVAFASIELLSSSVAQARYGWSFMLPLVAALLTAFAQRGRLAGGAALVLGRRGLLLGLVGLAVVIGARFSVRPAAAVAPPPQPHVVVVADSVASKPVEVPPAPAPEPSEPPPPAPSVPASAAPAASSAPVAPGAPGELQIEAVASKGLLEADARGGVQRRFDKLQACLSESNNQQSGALTLRVGIDTGGSVNYVRPVGGDLVGTPLAACLLPAFYKMGFAAPGSANAYVELTLRAPPR